MVQEIYTEFIRKILQNKPRLEKQLQVKITNKGKNLFLSGKPEHEFIALEIIQAINLGFSITRALLLKDENTNIRIAAARSLESIGTPQAKDALRTVLNDEISIVSNIAKCATKN